LASLLTARFERHHWDKQYPRERKRDLQEFDQFISLRGTNRLCGVSKTALNPMKITIVTEAKKPAGDFFLTSPARAGVGIHRGFDWKKVARPIPATAATQDTHRPRTIIPWTIILSPASR
jgi:hypothetical protein